MASEFSSEATDDPVRHIEILSGDSIGGYVKGIPSEFSYLPFVSE
jgi:hypothetical protein